MCGMRLPNCFVLSCLTMFVRPRPHISRYFWICNFFFPQSKISPSTRSKIYLNSMEISPDVCRRKAYPKRRKKTCGNKKNYGYVWAGPCCKRARKVQIVLLGKKWFWTVKFCLKFSKLTIIFWGREHGKGDY